MKPNEIVDQQITVLNKVAGRLTMMLQSRRLSRADLLDMSEDLLDVVRALRNVAEQK